MSIDEKIENLKAITDNLEKEDISLDEGLKLFDKGVDLAKECYKELNEYKGKITILKQEISKMREEDFE